MLHRILQNAEKEYREVVVEYSECRMSDETLAEFQQHLAKQYNKLYHMDHFNIIIIEGRTGEPDYHHPMSDEQMRRNKWLDCISP